MWRFTWRATSFLPGTCRCFEQVLYHTQSSPLSFRHIFRGPHSPVPPPRTLPRTGCSVTDRVRERWPEREHPHDAAPACGAISRIYFAVFASRGPHVLDCQDPITGRKIRRASFAFIEGLIVASARRNYRSPKLLFQYVQLSCTRMLAKSPMCFRYTILHPHPYLQFWAKGFSIAGD